MKKRFIIPLLLLSQLSFAQLEGINSEHLMQYLSDVDHKELRIQKIKLKTGVSLEYAEQGNNNGLPLIFLHGITDSRHSFHRSLQMLPDSIHAFAISQRGHGNSDKPSSGYTPKDFAADLAAFVESRQLGPVLVVGHSMGGVNAMQFALDYPQLLKGLVIVDSDASFHTNPGMPAFVQEVLAMKGAIIERDYMEAFQASTLATPIDSSDFHLYVEEGLKCPLPVFQQALEGLAKANLLNRLKEIRVPVAIFWGDKDLVCYETGQQLMHQQLQHAKRHTYHGIGHALHWEAPARFTSDLIDFLRLSFK